MSDKNYKVKFECPNDDCNSTRVEEVLKNVVQYSDISDLSVLSDGESVALDYGPTNYDGGELSCYQCSVCGELLHKNSASLVCNEQELYEWLKERRMLEEN